MGINLKIVGTALAETLIGNAGNDEIYAGGGADIVSGGLGNDNLFGEDGNDILNGGTGNDQLYGGAGDDRMLIGTGNQLYDGGNGFDTLDASAAIKNIRVDLSANTVRGLGNSEIRGVEKVIGTRFADSMVGGARNDVFESAGGDDTTRGGDGNDSLVGGAGNDRLYGDAGNDSLVFNATTGKGFTHTFDGGAGTDTLELRLTSAQYTAEVQAEIKSFLSFAANTANAGKVFAFNKIGFLQVSNVEAVRIIVDGSEVGGNVAPVVDAAHTSTALQSAHNHSVAGAIAATDANGDALTYSLKTGPANGTVTFTDANGHYTYQAGNGVGADSFVLQVSDGHGGLATQTVSVDVTNAGPVIGAGTMTSASTMHFQSVAGAIVASDADGDQVSFSVKDGPKNGTVSFLDANGHYVYTAGDAAGVDSFTMQVSDGHGGLATQTVSVGVIGTLDLSAAGAATSINLVTGTSVGSSPDVVKWAIDVKGSAFNDLLYGDTRDNVLRGGDGKDELHGAAGNDNLDGGTGDDKLYGEDGNDYLDGGYGVDLVNGGGGNDTLLGGVGNDGFFGGGGNDKVYGGDGNDRVYGDGGNDTIYGGAGNDTLSGGATGGVGDKGANTFAWERADAVTTKGASAGYDHITDFGAGDRLDFSQLFASHPSVVADAVHVSDVAGGTVVSAAIGAGGAFVDVVMLDGVHHVTVDDLAHANQLIV